MGLLDHAVLHLGHGPAKGLEVVGHGLVGQDVPVYQEQDPAHLSGLPQPPDDLEGGVGLARTGRHHEQDSSVAPHHGLDGPLDGDALVVTGFLAAAVIVVRRPDQLAAVVGEALPRLVAVPEVLRTRKLRHRQGALDGIARAGQIVKDEGIAVGGEGVGHIERTGIVDGLLHPRAGAVLVVLRLDHGQREVGLEEQQVVRPHLFAAHGHLAADADAACGEGVFAADLRRPVPARGVDRGRDELVADVRFREGGLGGRTHAAPPGSVAAWSREARARSDAINTVRSTRQAPPTLTAPGSFPLRALV